VSTSFSGKVVPTDNVVKASDFILIHGNGADTPTVIQGLIDKTKQLPSYRSMPIVINEDDHFNFEKETNNFIVAIQNYVSCGYFDVSKKAGIFTQLFGLSAIVAGDNLEGWPDIYLGNDFKNPDQATKALRLKYEIISNPTFIFIDTNGMVMHKGGYKTVDDFSKMGKQALSTDNYRNWKDKIETGNFDTEVLNKYLSVEQNAALYAESGYQCA